MLSTLVERNGRYFTERLTSFQVVTRELRPGENVSVIANPTASKMNYKLLYPTVYSNVQALGSLDDLASLVNAPSDWKKKFEKLQKSSAVKSAFYYFRNLPTDTSEADVSAQLCLLVSTMATGLDIGISAKQETPVTVGGLLFDPSYYLKSNTDIHFVKDGRTVIATEVKKVSAFPLGAVWYRDSRGVQATAAMYAHDSATFLLTTEHWKLIVQNQNRDRILTYPYSADRPSTSVKPLGPTLVEALCVCLLSEAFGPDSKETALSASEQVWVQTPEPKQTKHIGSVENAAKRGRHVSSGGKDSSGEGGPNSSKFLLGSFGGQEVYRNVRVLSADEVRAIENQIAAELVKIS